MQEEIDSVKRNQTWELADLPQGHRAITLKWVYKLKRNEAGEIVKHKSRLVARGFVQQEWIDFDEVFSPVARVESVRLLLTLAAQEGWQVHHMDVKSAFLNGDLKEEVYVRQPTGFIVVDQEGKVLRLRKALYGLRQAPRAWNSKLDDTLKKMNFVQSEHEHAMYWRSHGDDILLVGVRGRFGNHWVILGSSGRVQGGDEEGVLDERHRIVVLLSWHRGAPGCRRHHIAADALCQEDPGDGGHGGLQGCSNTDGGEA
jgi:nucleotide-binding universal stress UspA family protein